MANRSRAAMRTIRQEEMVDEEFDKAYRKEQVRQARIQGRRKAMPKSSGIRYDRLKKTAKGIAKSRAKKLRNASPLIQLGNVDKSARSGASGKLASSIYQIYKPRKKKMKKKRYKNRIVIYQ